MKTRYLFFSLLLLVMSCNKEDNNNKTPEGVVKYEVTFNMKWSAANFPIDYPSNAHFSKLIGWSHRKDYTFFQPGTYASPGIKEMAEKGSTSPLDDEINNEIDYKEGLKLFIGNGLSSGTGTIKIEVYVNESNPNITLVTMLAPSPDWYLGVIDISMLDGGEFVDTKTIKAIVYDSGSDSGVSFKSENKVTKPQDEIHVFKSYPLGDGIADLDIADVTFKRID